MKKRKALTWAMSGVLTALVILALYLRGASGPAPSEVSQATPASKVLQQNQQPHLAARVAPAPTVPLPEIPVPVPERMEQTDIQPEAEAVDVEPSGMVVGQAVMEEEPPLDPEPEATGVLPADSAPKAESIEQTEIEPEVEAVDVEPSGVVVGQAMQEDIPFDPAAAGLTSP